MLSPYLFPQNEINEFLKKIGIAFGGDSIDVAKADRILENVVS